MHRLLCHFQPWLLHHQLHYSVCRKVNGSAQSLDVMGSALKWPRPLYIQSLGWLINMIVSLGSRMWLHLIPVEGDEGLVTNSPGHSVVFYYELSGATFP